MSAPLSFEPLYYKERLNLINPTGDVGVATLWTPVNTAVDYMKNLGIDLGPETSRIAVVANLYGDGLAQMIRNLLWNPQIRHLLIFGQPLTEAGAELENLLTLGAEPVEDMGQKRLLIRGTDRKLDSHFDPSLLQGYYKIKRYGKPSLPETKQGVGTFFSDLPPPVPAARDRIEAPLPQFKPNFFPSEARSHTITRRRPLDAWEEVVCRIMRFGVPSVAGVTKQRLELQNLKVVITEPVEDRDEDLRPYGYSREKFARYQQEFLCGDVPEDVQYTYGSRMRGGWPGLDGRTDDAVTFIANKLAESPSERSAFISIWHTPEDLFAPEERSRPCLASLFFRVFQGHLTLNATFRLHNVMSAWLMNVYGLIALQREVAEKAGGLPIGPITVVSQSISIDPDSQDRFAVAQQILANKIDDLELDRETGKRILREDPNGYFTFTTDNETSEIVVDLKMGGETLQRYRGKTAESVENQISRDNAISDIGHALYVGRQLAIMEQRLKKGQAES
ncbi:MAG: hypothetical protein IPI58_01015 [Alphaproteobacteria bacterium]|nr:MAG: hypothetical protein IPI58_01015 [Alphaproteobacteria bacterium]